MRLINTVLALLLAVLVACLVWLMVHAGSVRPMQDDYLYLTFTSSERFQQSFTESFGQNGRLTVLGLTFVLGGMGLHWVAALVSFPLLAGGAGALMAEFLRRVTTLPPRTLGLASACTGALVALSFYLVTPSPYSVTYWLAGAPIHLWPYCLILLLASGYLRGQRRGTLSTSTVLFLAVGVLVVAMMSEMSALILLGLGGVATASTPGAWVVKLKRRGVLMLAALVGLLVVLFAPAAVNRRLAEKSKPLTENLAVFPSVVADTLEWLVRGGLQHRTMILLFVALLTVFFLAIPVKFIPRKVLLLWGAALAVVLTGIVCVNIMAVYSSIGIVWNRSQGLTTLCLLLGCVYVAFLAARVGRYVARRLRVPLRPVVIVSAVLVGALALLVAPGFVRDLRASMATIVKRAAASDARMPAIDAMRRAGRCDPLPTTFIVGMQEGYDLIATPSPINIRFSQYYGFSCQILGDMTRQEAKRTVAAKPR